MDAVGTCFVNGLLDFGHLSADGLVDFDFDVLESLLAFLHGACYVVLEYQVEVVYFA